uniref:CXADR-like membrane protein n=2 Tax=Kryptolebias marmoratus TaxID=37003 RepID=A0A3Q3BQD3_KRYMA
MKLYNKNILWSFMFLLAGAAGVTIQYPFLSTCAFKGSTVTLPCSFTPRKSFSRDGREIPLKVVRVRWCKNHEICHSTTPSVFDSNSTTNDPGYEYLGDLKGNCTLRIRNIKTSDEPTFRFRMEADDSAGHFTNRTGVKVSVVEGSRMRIKSSSDVTELRGGQSVSLQCTSPFCTFYHLNITWTKDGHALPETGPALQLGPLTSEDSGNYTCGLKTNSGSRSEPIRLQVEAEENPSTLPLIVGGVFGFLLVLIVFILVFLLIQRKRAAGSRAARGEMELKRDDNVYSSVLPAGDAGHQRTETSQEDDGISYASVQFKHNKHKKKLEEEADSIIYSSVVTKG